MCNLYISECLYLWPEAWRQARFVTFTLQAYGKILKCLLLRVSESKPPNSFSIMEDYVNGNDAGAAYWQGHREKSSEVTWRHKSYLLINHDMMVLKTWSGIDLLAWSRRIVWYAAWPYPTTSLVNDLTLTSGQISNWSVNVIAYLFCIASTRATKNVWTLCLYVY